MFLAEGSLCGTSRRLAQIELGHNQTLLEGSRLVEDIAQYINDHRIAVGRVASSEVVSIRRGVRHDGVDHIFGGS